MGTRLLSAGYASGGDSGDALIPAYLEFIDRFSYFPLYFDEIIDGKRIQTYLILTRFLELNGLKEVFFCR